MALIKCPECGRQVSSQASACPNCGYPIKGVSFTARATPAAPAMLKFTSKDRTAKFAIVRHANTGRELARIDRETARSINITRPTEITFHVRFAMGLCSHSYNYVIQPGKCYELKYYKKTFAWDVGISEVSAIV
jgi:uncharacterized OB-fold protein